MLNKHLLKWGYVGILKKSENNKNSGQGSITNDDNIEVIISKTDHNHSACPVEVMR